MFVLCPGLCTPYEAAGHCSGIRNEQCWFGWAGSLRHPWVQNPQVCRRGLQGLLSMLQVGMGLLIAVHKIRIQDWVWSTGFKFRCEFMHSGERPQQPSVLNITVCTELLLAGCFFMLQEFLFFIHSIPFYMILNSFLAIFLFL